MKTVLVTGGTGNLGGHVIDALIESGHQVRMASRRPAPADGTRRPYRWDTVDYRTRAGVHEALAGADSVVHCASGSSRGESETIAALLSSGRRAGLPHLVYISIVGVDRLPLGYYRAKVAAERALVMSGMGWTILRTTQFHDLALTMAKALCRMPIGVAPSGVDVQPVAVGEVAARLAELAAGPPAGREQMGGPEILPLHRIARQYLAAVGSHKRVVVLPFPGRLVNGLRRGHGLTPEHREGVGTFADFLAQRVESA